MSTYEVAFRVRIDLLRTSCPDELRSILESPEALLLPLIDSRGIVATSEDNGQGPECVTPRLGGPSRSWD